MLNTITPHERRTSLRAALQANKCLRVLEAHNAISAVLIESTYHREQDGDQVICYDGFWSSSLVDSTVRGKPDIEILDIPSRLANIQDLFEVTTKPLIMDGDTGGKIEHFTRHIRSLERAGISAVIIEDKTGLKRNSLLGNEVHQQQESLEAFCHKISSGKAAQITRDFMLIARVESLILDLGMSDALKRAFAYVEAGADGIMIHSKRESCDEIMEFSQQFKSKFPTVPLVCVPTSYKQVYFSDLERAGFNIVIYANHMLRAAYRAMQRTAADILKYGRTLEIEPYCLSIKETLGLIPDTR